MKRTLVALGLLLATAAVSAEDLPIYVGGGVGSLVYSNVQKMSYAEVATESRLVLTYWGVNAFADITPYFTVSGGLWKGWGDAQSAYRGGGEANLELVENNITELEIGVYGKYPFILGDKVTLTPKLGLNSIMYLTGDLGGNEPQDDDDRHMVSPLSLTFGWDVDLNLGDGWITRVPFEFGVALNSRLSDNFYGSNKAEASSVISFKAGLALVRKL